MRIQFNGRFPDNSTAILGGSVIQSPEGFEDFTFIAHKLASGHWAISEWLSGARVIGPGFQCHTKKEAVERLLLLVSNSCPRELTARIQEFILLNGQANGKMIFEIARNHAC